MVEDSLVRDSVVMGNVAVTNNIVINFDNYTTDHLDIEKFKDNCRKAFSCTKVIENYIKDVFFNPECPENMSIKLTNLRPDYKFMDVYRDGWEKDLQSKIFRTLVKHSVSLTQRMLKDENPEHTMVDSDDEMYDVLKRDVLKDYEQKFFNNRKGFGTDLKEEAKKTIYNQSVIHHVSVDT